jgi:hypothetical protein
MANTYDWGAFSLDSKPTADGTDFVVGVIHYRRTGTDDSGNFSDDTYGVIALPEPDPNNYIPFSQVDRALVIQWVEDILGAVPPAPILTEGEEEKEYDKTTILERLNTSVDEKLAKFVVAEQVVTTTL